MRAIAYDMYQSQIGVRISYLISDADKKHPNSLELTSYDAYKQRSCRVPGFRLKSGKGPGNEALVSWEAMPHEWKEMCKSKFGDPSVDYNPLEKHFQISPEAKAYYDNFQFDNDEYLTPEQKKKYTLNASVMESIIRLKSDRLAQRKSRGGSIRGIWDTLANDTVAFNDRLKALGHGQHTLPGSVKRLRMRHDNFLKFKYEEFVDKRNNNNNAQVVTPVMIELWQAIFAGQRNRKPTYIEVALRYEAFLKGDLDIINNQTGELFNPNNPEYRPASESSVYSYQAAWAQRAVSFSLRSGDNQKFKAAFDPWHRLKQPEFAGSMISIDDRQPPFEYAPGKRMWFYNAIDLGSEAFTCWVWGDTKEGIIEEFYRQIVRNYMAWGLKLPYELECEMSLNSSYKDNLLANGAMFQQVRIEANNARGKRIEAYYRQLRYGFEKEEDGWIARPFAISESNQKGAGKLPILPKDQIVQNALRAIENWNNTLHSDQNLNPGMTRWEVFMEKQHPELTETNWAGILPHIGYETKSSMNLGRIILQGKHRVVGYDGEVALGAKLINILKRIEGKDLIVKWLDDHEGNVLKSLVYDLEGNQICELLGDLGYNRSTLERKGKVDEEQNREIMSAYAATVQGYIRRNAHQIESVTLIEKPKQTKKAFVMPGLAKYTESKREPEVLESEEVINDQQYTKKYSTSTADRF
ncbi:hypothetical protein MM236_19010 [Belliella sp. DSM 107340]|uniref:Terminase n=1 Tax=Belliella calami TaxID=2923436 RepID=A0ABS9UUC3_9BACT|nr:hypothetical protein [Belliella calami]MCH7400093.1 hypothetical protein [Belliella calami]